MELRTAQLLYLMNNLELKTAAVQLALAFHRSTGANWRMSKLPQNLYMNGFELFHLTTNQVFSAFGTFVCRYV